MSGDEMIIYYVEKYQPVESQHSGGKSDGTW